jgi:hypothetical protein
MLPRSPNLITPAVRERRPVPKVALGALGAAWLIAIVNPAHASSFTSAVDTVVKIAAILAGASIATWFEERVYAKLVGRAPWLRLVVALALPPLALVCAPLAAVVLGVPGSFVGDDGTLVLAALFGSLWLASAAAGSAIGLARHCDQCPGARLPFAHSARGAVADRAAAVEPSSLPTPRKKQASARRCS